MQKRKHQRSDIPYAHLKTRLEQLGFLVKDGHMFCIENTETGQFVTAAKLLESKGT